MNTDAPSLMPLRCRLGRHAPEPVARWNAGYYFSRCRRCGADLVRTDYGKWEPPKGFRVVWRSSRPEQALGADLVEAVKIETPSPAPMPLSPPEAETLPIQEVLRSLQEDEEAIETEAEDAARPNLPPLPSRPSRVPDFMAEPDADSDWGATPPPPRPRAPAPEPRPEPRFTPAFAAFDEPEPEPAPVIAEEEPAEEAPRRVRDRRRMTMAAAALVLMVFVVALMGWGEGSIAGQNAPVPQRASLGAGQPVFVTASGLACRAEPGGETAEVRQLVRGDAVRLIARDGDWASIAYQGEQCWTPVRYLSVERPM